MRAGTAFLAALDDEDRDANRKPLTLVAPMNPCSAWTEWPTSAILQHI